MPGILIADDNPSIRFLLRHFAESSGYQVCGEVSNGTDAIEKAKQLQPDLLLLDLSMPVLNGAEAASVLKRMMPQMRIILFTMHAEGLSRALADATRADVVLSKQDGLSKLGDHLKALLPQTAVSATSKAPTANPLTSAENLN